MTRQIVEAAFEALVEFDSVGEVMPVPEAEIPSMILILNTAGLDN